MRRSGERVRINAQLIDASSDEHLWAEIYDRDLVDVFAIQSDVAQQIAGALQATLTSAEKERIERRPTENLEAYDYYLRGNAFMDRFGYYNESVRAVELYGRALELDPELAAAWANLSRAHSALYWSYIDHSPERLALARESFERAFEIEPDLPAAHVAAGFYHYYGSRDYDSAIEEFDAALASQPNDVDALEGIAWVYRRLGRWEIALANLKRAAALAPGVHDKLLTTGETLLYMGRHEEAEGVYLRALEEQTDHDQVLRMRAWVHTSWTGDVSRARSFLEEPLHAGRPSVFPGADDLQAWWLVRAIYPNDDRILDRMSLATFGDDTVVYLLAVAQLTSNGDDGEAARSAYAEAAAVLERQVAEEPEDARYHSELGVAYAGLGREEDAVREGKRAVELLPPSRDALWGRAYVENLALIYVMLGRHEEALEQLETVATLAGPITPAWLRVDPAWDALRELPRFQRLVERES